MKAWWGALCFGLALGLPVAGNAGGERADIPLEEWRNLALGRTLVYMIGPDFFAFERYAKTGNRVELQLSNGECLSGTWSHAGTAYCFDWGDAEPACFRHVREGEDIIIIQLENGEDTELTQQMTGFTDAPLTCGMQMS